MILRLTFECGPGGIVAGQVFTVALSLWTPHEAPSSSGSLPMAALAGDPRVHLDPNSPGIANDDPPTKTALIIAPYVYRDVPGEPEDVDWLTPLSDYVGGEPTAAPNPAKFSLIPALRKAGYNPVAL